jgi:tetratricopeptide (TPR) repeat protein
MSWGIMSLGLSPNVRVSLVVLLAFLPLASAWAKVAYSPAELRAVEKSDETQIRDLRSEEIRQLRITLGRRLPANRQADLYFRLAEIYMEAYHSEFLLEGRVHEKRLEQGTADQFIDRSSSQPFLRAGIVACKEVVGFKIRYDKLDQIYYFLGFYYGELEQRAESSQYYEYLVHNFPNSPFTAPAYKELGENYYHSAQFAKATEYLEQSLHRSPPEHQPPLLHKLAWCYYRTKQYDRAISTMKETIASSGKQGDRFLPLRSEALRDMATLMAERGRVDEAVKYFQEVVGDPALLPKILEKLARQYERNVETDKAIVIYETLLKTHPESEEAFRVLVKLIELDIKQNRFKDVAAKLRKTALPEGADSETLAALQNLRVMVRKTATENHQKFRKTQDRAALEIAESFYGLYLDVFLKKGDPHHEIPEIQMYLAEVKHSQGKSREVAELYRRVVASQDKKFAKEAGALWTASLVEAIKKEPSRAGQSDPSALEKEYIEASDLMQGTLGESNEAKDMALRTTRVLAGYPNTKPDAVVRIKAIMSRWSKSAQALTAAQLWLQLTLDQKNAKDNPDEVGSLVTELAANTDLMATDRATNKSKFRNYLDDLTTKMRVGAIAKQEHSNNFSGAAKGYEDYAALATDKGLAEKAYLNALNMYQKVEGSFDDQLRVIDVWSKRYPRSPKTVECLRAVATYALVHGQFELSAKLFRKLGTEYKERDSLETAARFYEGIGDTEHAQQNWASYLDLYRDSPQRWRVALKLARSQEAAHQDSEAGKSYRYCAAGPPDFQAECTSRLADLYYRNRDLEQAKASFRRVGNLGSKKNSDSGSPFVGYARFRIAEITESEATFDPLKLPDAQLQKALNQRLTFLEPLSKSYQSVVQAGGPWGVAALHRLALFAVHFADEVDAIEPSPTLKPSSQEKFRRNLATVSGPLRNKAQTTWNEGYSKAIAQGLLSPALPEVADHLADFRVAVPGRAQGPRGQFHLAGVAADGGAEGAAMAFTQVRDRLSKNVKDGAAWADYGNLLWGENKPLMAKVAYERALTLNSKNPAVLNNLGVVVIMSESEEDWLAVAEGSHYFEEALRMDDFFVPAKMNLATLLNYYRSFRRAKSLWDQVLARGTNKDGEAGLAVALQGSGNIPAAVGAFQRAEDQGVGKSQFVESYHEAARASIKGAEGAGQCVTILAGMDSSAIGFEKLAVEHLKGKCEAWTRR